MDERRTVLIPPARILPLMMPTHPELLDWLAGRFTGADWSIKRIHRDIVNSATYRLGSNFNQRNFDVDGDNKLLWRMNPRRLDVEGWRDALLSVTGELDLRVGGPPVNDILASSRRTLYAPIRRSSRFASDRFLRLFDFPNPWLSNSQRTVTTIPPQQLFMLNSGFMIERARALAERLADLSLSNPGGDGARIDRAYRLLYSRRPRARLARDHPLPHGPGSRASHLSLFRARFSPHRCLRPGDSRRDRLNRCATPGNLGTRVFAPEAAPAIFILGFFVRRATTTGVFLGTWGGALLSL